MRIRLISALAILSFLVAGAVSAQDARVTVEMRLDGEAAIPAGSALEVRLLDVSRQDAPAEVVSMQRYQAGGFPARVRLPYDPGKIDERMTYVISTRIVSNGDVLYRTTSSYPVLTRGASDSVEVVMDQMKAASTVPDLSGTKWTAYEIGGRAFVGDAPPELTFVSGSDFGLFTGCNNFRGSASITSDSIAFPETMAGTLKACPPPRDKLEKDVLEAFRNATGYSYNGNTLVLTNAAGVSLIRFRRAS